VTDQEAFELIFACNKIHTKEQLKALQSLTLEQKIQATKVRIDEWYNHYEGNVYVSFSGGKDSTVLLDIVRQSYPEIEAVYVDTGLEYPEIRDFVKTKENVTWLKPELSFYEVLKKYGYPIISKEVSRDIAVARRKPDGKTADKFNPNSDYCKKYGMQWCLNKWDFLKDSDIPISNQCCNIMKKRPAKKYKKETNKKAILAIMTCESRERKQNWLKSGCNAFDNNDPQSNPMSFWTEQDVLQYLITYKIPYASIYGDIIKNRKGKLETTGAERTGCMFCCYGIQCEKEPNRFQRMKVTHPKQYDYCIHKLGIGKILDFIGVKY
jgi:3'-phosphoadenosine 5'-phosphosulfate sulfotransferase (PAPS reductase)/FAD synthetase